MTNEDQRWVDSFEVHAQRLIEENKVPAVAIGLAKEGQLIYQQAFGFRNLEEQTGVTMDTIFGIGSITKSFTCMAIMQLQEAGKLYVHDQVITYLPELRLKNSFVEQIKIHHLMTHTSGLPPLPTLFHAMRPSMMNDPAGQEVLKGFIAEEPFTIENYKDLIAYLSGLDFELLGPPGTEFSYSNEGYALLGAIIERVSGKTYEECIQDQILTPAGMSNSVFVLDELDGPTDIATLYATGLVFGDTEIVASPIWWDAPAMRAAGFLKSTIRNMLTYLDIFRTGGLAQEGRIVSSQSIEDMMKPFVQIDPNRYYGYGLGIHENYLGMRLIEHTGGLKGIASQMFIVPDCDITGIILTNLEGVPVGEIMAGLFNCRNSRPADAQVYTCNSFSIASHLLSDYVGIYESREGVKIAIELQNGQLVLQFLSAYFDLRAVGEDRFAFTVKGTDRHIRFIRHEGGAVSRVSFGARQLHKNG
ncbi:serine hydrolase [Paenibacillus aestuarii]|uniref:Serine hydrolase n=1 Tax=Paenibacillus aestuarii TaxID=516965 RepID=A0ABW0K9F8_9BACL|nr:serine hydrolase [Paenibacillus aestuarii]